MWHQVESKGQLISIEPTTESEFFSRDKVAEPTQLRLDPLTWCKRYTQISIDQLR